MERDVIQIEFLLLKNGKPVAKIVELALFSSWDDAERDFESLNWNTVTQKVKLIFKDTTQVNGCIASLLKNGVPVTYSNLINNLNI